MKIIFEDEQVKVSICCLVYNHDLFLESCIEGFLYQETDFPFEVLIHDDASSDSSVQILEKYHKLYPDIIKPIYQSENQKSKGYRMNPTFNFPRAKGKYLAICEGDDCWNDNSKLQKQIDFLEANPDYSMSFHAVDRFNVDTQTIESQFPSIMQDKDFDIYDFIKGNQAMTCSVVYRKSAFDSYPENFNKFKMGDWVLNILASSKGKVKYFHDIMGLYNVHSQGTWSSRTELRKNKDTIYMLEEMNKYFEGKYNKEFSKVIIKQLYQQVKYYIEKKQYKKAKIIYRYTKKNYSLNLLQHYKFIKKLYL